MSLYIAAFTGRGAILCARLLRELPNSAGFVPERYVTEGLNPLTEPVTEWAGRRFGSGNGLIFIGAAGIAVRAIAPHVCAKDRDSAVVCLDEEGRFVVPLLSGHIGGAAELAGRVASITGGTAVLTAATDVRGVFSPDAWAVRAGCAVPHTGQIKHVSAALLRGEPVGFDCDFDVEGMLPEGIVSGTGTSCGILISLRESRPFEHTLWLVPRVLTVGVGCVRNIDADLLERRILEVLSANGLTLRGVEALASIDLKVDEPAILRFCEKYRLPLYAYPAERLAEARGSVSPSRFVEKTVGVDNVCERAALLCGEDLIVPKNAGEGVTIAISRRKWRALFCD